VKGQNSLWTKVLIKDACESIIDCVNKTAPAVEKPTQYKMIRTTNVKAGWVNLSAVKFVNEDVYKKWTRRGKPRKGDVILTREAPLGEVGMLRSNDTVFLGQRLVQYRADPDKLDNRFLLYSFQGDFLQGQIKSLGSGATVEHMRVPDAEKLMLLLPPLSTQRKIAAILSAYDDLIENNTRRIKILEEMAQALYREWFVKFRFPGHEKVKMVESKMGMVPEGWRVAKLGDVLEIRKGKNITKKTITKGTVPVVAGGLAPAYCHSQANTHYPVVTISASGANAGFVNLYQEDIWASDCSYVDKDTTPFVYFYYLFFKCNQVGVTRLQRGSAQPHVYPKDLMELPTMEVPRKTLEGFEQDIAPVFEMIRNRNIQNKNLRRTRNLLLPKLISGEVDVENIDVLMPNNGGA